MSAVDNVVNLFEQKFGTDYNRQIDFHTFYQLVHEALPSKSSKQCETLFNEVSAAYNEQLTFRNLIEHDKFKSFMEQSAKMVNFHIVDYHEDAEDDKSDSFVPNDDIQFGPELTPNPPHSKSHVLSSLDVEILQNQLREMFKQKYGDDADSHSIDFHEFCDIVKSMTSSPGENAAIKAFFNELDSEHTNKIAIREFLQTDTFSRFLRNALNFTVLDKQKTITNDQLEREMNEKNRFFYRALSIHDLHDREIIVSDRQTIERLQRWIDVYGKPAIVRTQNLQLELEQRELLITTLEQTVDELRGDILELKEENESILALTTNLKENASSLQQHVSIFNEEHEQLLKLESHRSENVSKELQTLKLKVSQSISTTETLEEENKSLRELRSQSMNQKRSIERKLREKDFKIQALDMENRDLKASIQALEQQCKQQQTDINLLESENAEHQQEIELLRMKTAPKSPFRALSRDQLFEQAAEDMMGAEVVDIGMTRLGFGSPVVNMQDDIIAIPDVTLEEEAEVDEFVNDDDDDDGETLDYRLLHQKSMDAMHEYRAQIVELKQQLLEEQRKREELQQEIELKMEQELRESMIRRRARSHDQEQEHVQLIVRGGANHQQIALIVEDNEDDVSSPDELQPMIADKPNEKEETGSGEVKKLKTTPDPPKAPRCCGFLFGIC